MKWIDFLNITQALPLIETEVILSGKQKVKPERVQLSRWVKSGNLIQLRRGVYLLNKPYRKQDINEYHIASVLVKPSYISFEKALEYHGLIPESVPVYTSVTTKRPERVETDIGVFDYRHIKIALFYGYQAVLIGTQQTFIARPEKALLDLLYFKKAGELMSYLAEMRLQNTGKINIPIFLKYARQFNRRDMINSAKTVVKYLNLSEKEKVI